MPNTSFPKGMERLLSAQLDLSSGSIKAALVTDAYAFSTAHEFLSQCGTRVGTDQTLTNNTVANGVFDADDLDFGVIAPGHNIKALVVYQDTGNPATSPLIFYYDSVPGLPMASNGGGVTVPWDNGARKIARLGLPFYPISAQKIMAGLLNVSTAALKVALLPSAYVYGESHEFWGDIGAHIGEPLLLTGMTVAGGVLDGDDVDFGALPAGSTVGSVAVFAESGDAATSPLLLHIPTQGVTGLPLATNGGGISLQWSNGSLKIVSLTPA